MKRFSKAISILLILLNIISAVFYAVYSLVNISFSCINIFALITYILICVDLLYSSTRKSKRSIALIIFTAFLFTINFASNYIAGLSAYTLEKNYIGIISIILLFLVNALFIFADLKKSHKNIEANKTFAILLSAAGIMFLFSIFIVGLISLFAKTPVNTNTVNLSLLFIVLCCAVFALVLILSDGFRSKNTKMLVSAMFIFAAVPFVILQSSVVFDIKQTNEEFKDINISAENNMREVPYSLADEFVGIKTDDFEINRDIVYYSSDSGFDNGMTLRCDMYFPENTDDKKSVLVNLHGSGGDKDIGNYAHRNKYFASRGYVVYDLQFGDWNEKGTGFTDDMYGVSENMLFYIDKFFEYLSKNNEADADLSSVFITGVSMGGGLASKYAYSYDNHLDDYGIQLKGIIPIYPGYHPDNEGIDNYLNYVDKDSVPAMIVMGTGDCIVRPEAVEETKASYDNVNNPNLFALEISYGGHGSDSLMTGRFNQLVMYYAERFMKQMK